MTMIDGIADLTGLRSGIATWLEVETDFWVGNADGVFFGTIERHAPSRYFARDAFRRYVGEYTTLESARTAIAERMG